MTATSKTIRQPTLAATVAGEDIACGDYVAVLSELYELPSYMWDSCGATLSPYELVRLTLISRMGGVPHKVFAVCLPFVYARTHNGATVIFDVRRQQLARLDRRTAKIAWKNLLKAGEAKFSA